MNCSLATRSTLRCLNFIATLSLFFLLLPSAGESVLVDKVVAVVNDDVITLSEVEEESARVFQSMAKDSSGQVSANLLAEAREATLNGLIDRRLLAQRAKQTNTTVTDEELSAAYDNARNRMGLDQVEFKKKLERSGMTEENLRKQIRDQVLQSKLVGFEVRAKIVVTEEMIRDYYNEHHIAKIDKGSYYLLQMGFQWNPEISDVVKKQEEKTETRKRAERALDQVKKGEDFKAVAKKFSDLPSAIDGGDLGVLKLDDMAPFMRAAVSSLQPGDISKIIETADGYQFYKLLSAKDEATSTSSAYDKVKDEIREKLYEEKLKTAYSEWVKKLKENAYIQKM